MPQCASSRPTLVFLIAVTEQSLGTLIPAYCKGPSWREGITAGSTPVCDGQQLGSISEDQEAEKGSLALSWAPSFSIKSLAHGIESPMLVWSFLDKTFTDTTGLPH